MANIAEKVKENSPGHFYVDADCIACDTCTQITSDHFALTDTQSHAYVKVQPKTGPEHDVVYKAISQCPVEAIGDDGH